MSYTPDDFVQVFAASPTSAEVRNGAAFRWLSTAYDYNIIIFSKYFEEFSRYWRTLPGQPAVYNDFSDSGYYLLVEDLLSRNGIRHSDDPWQCEYFLGLNRRIGPVLDRMERTPSVTLAAVTTEAGKPRVGEKTYILPKVETRVWSNDLLEAVRIPKEGREIAPIGGLDQQGLVEVIRKYGLSVEDGISPREHERWYLEAQLAAAGIRSTVDSADAVLLCVPNFMLLEAAKAIPSFQSQWCGMHRKTLRGRKAIR